MNQPANPRVNMIPIFAFSISVNHQVQLASVGQRTHELSIRITRKPSHMKFNFLRQLIGKVFCKIMKPTLNAKLSIVT